MKNKSEKVALKLLFSDGSDLTIIVVENKKARFSINNQTHEVIVLREPNEEKRTAYINSTFHSREIDLEASKHPDVKMGPHITEVSQVEIPKLRPEQKARNTVMKTNQAGEMEIHYRDPETQAIIVLWGWVCVFNGESYICHPAIFILAV